MSGNRKRALVVDDEPEDLEMLRTVLAKLGYDVFTAGDGETALRTFFNHPETISLVVTDVAMSPMDGCELAASLLRADPSLRVVFVSGYVGTEAFRYQHHHLQRVFPFLRKPLKAGELEREIQVVLKAVA